MKHELIHVPSHPTVGVVHVAHVDHAVHAPAGAGRRALTMLAAPLCALALAGCLATPGGTAGNVAEVSRYDYAVLEGFHDARLQEGSTVASFKAQLTPLALMSGGGKDVWEQTFELTPAGLGKVHVREPNARPFGGRDDYRPAFYKVSVESAEARNLRWEVWTTENDYQVHLSGGLFGGSSKLTFKKIMGPFNNGEVVKVDFVPTGTTNAWGTLYAARRPLIVAYSPGEPGKRFVVKLHKAELAPQ